MTLDLNNTVDIASNLPARIKQALFLFWKPLNGKKSPVGSDCNAITLSDAPKFTYEQLLDLPLNSPLRQCKLGLYLAGSDITAFDFDLYGDATYEDIANHADGGKLFNELKDKAFFHITPSGNLRALVIGGAIAGDHLKRHFDLGDNKGFSIEVFSGEYHTQWVTISDNDNVVINGEHYGTRDLKPYPIVIKGIIKRFFINHEAGYVIPVDPVHHTNLSKETILKLMFGGVDGELYKQCFEGKRVFTARDGDSSESTQHTRLLARAAFFTGGDVDLMLEIFQESAWWHTDFFHAKNRAKRFRNRVARIAARQVKYGFFKPDWKPDENRQRKANPNGYDPEDPHPIFNGAFNWQQEIVTRNLLNRFNDFEGCNVINILAEDLNKDPLTGKHKYLDHTLVKQRSKVTCISSGMGTGKTTMLKPIIEKAKSVALICHRILLAKSHADDFNLTYYDDAKKADKKPNKVSTTINSLLSVISDNKPPKLLLLDEVESTLASLLNTVDDPKKVIEAFKFLFSQAEQIICLDAFLSTTVLAFLELCGIQRSEITIYKLDENVSFPDTKAYWHETRGTAEQVIESRLYNGNQTLLFCNSKKQADLAYQRFKKKFPDAAILLITSDTSNYEDQQNFAKKPNDYGKLYDLIITSPSIDAGTSLTLPEFDCVVAFFSVHASGTGNTQAAIQQLGRSRKSISWHIWCEHKWLGWPTNTDEIIKGKISLLDLERLLVDQGKNQNTSITLNEIMVCLGHDELTQLNAEITAFNNMQVNNFAMSLYAIINNKMGLPVVLIEENEDLTDRFKTQTNEAKEALICARLNLLRQQEPLSDADYYAMKDDMQWRLENRLRIQRYAFEDNYGVNICDDVTQYDDLSMFDLLRMHIDDRLLSRVKASETVVFTEHGELPHQYATTQLNGGMAATEDKNGKTQYIERKKAHVTEQSHDLLIQYEVRRLALDAVGLDPETLEIKTAVYFNADTIKQTPFYQFCIEHAQAINASNRIPISVTSNFIDKPNQALRLLLSQLGVEAKRQKVEMSKIKPVNHDDSKVLTHPSPLIYKDTGAGVGQDHDDNVGNEGGCSKAKADRVHAYKVVNSYNLIRAIAQNRLERGAHWLRRWANSYVTPDDCQLIEELKLFDVGDIPQLYRDNVDIEKIKWFKQLTAPLTHDERVKVAQLHNKTINETLADYDESDPQVEEFASQDADQLMTDVIKVLVDKQAPNREALLEMME